MSSISSRPPRFLVVCTANVCRSPMAEALLTRLLADNEVPALVRSSGQQEAGRPVSPNSVTAMAERGVDIAAHRSRTTSAHTIAGADLIITMTREHVRHVVQEDMDAWPRTFPLKTLVRRAGEVGARAADESFPDWVHRLHVGRMPSDVLRDDPADDIADPMGKALPDYRSTAEVLSNLLSRFVGYAFPPGASRSIGR